MAIQWFKFSLTTFLVVITLSAVSFRIGYALGYTQGYDIGALRENDHRYTEFQDRRQMPVQANP